MTPDAPPSTDPKRLWSASPIAPFASTRFDDAFRDDLLRLLRWRRDVRRFRREPLPDGTLERLIDVAALAPSVGLSQPWRFVSVADAGRRRAVRENFERCNAEALRRQVGDRSTLYARLKLAGMDEAPCQFALFADRTCSQGHGLGRLTMPEAIEYSAVMALHTLWLAARAEGIGLGWVSILDPASLSRDLDVPIEWTFVGYFCCGYPSAVDDTPALEREGWEVRCSPLATLLRR